MCAQAQVTLQSVSGGGAQGIGNHGAAGKEPPPTHEQGRHSVCMWRGAGIHMTSNTASQWKATRFKARSQEYLTSEKKPLHEQEKEIELPS